MSANGNDHIHVAICLVREDGRWANEHRSFKRSREVGDRLEENGLRPVKGHEGQRGMLSYSKGEARRMRESAAPIPERQRLAMVIRTAAMHAGGSSGTLSSRGWSHHGSAQVSGRAP